VKIEYKTAVVPAEDIVFKPGKVYVTKGSAPLRSKTLYICTDSYALINLESGYESVALQRDQWTEVDATVVVSVPDADRR
jgi:hypothetical protein